MSRTETNPDKINHTIIPAAACLALLTMGTLSVYGSFDLLLPFIVSISAVCILYLLIVMVVGQKTSF
jgi:hypothetical protein